MKILVIQLKMIGDVLATSIICNNLKAIYPKAQVDYVVYPFTKPVVEHNPNIDNIIIFEDIFRSSKKALFKFLLSIRKKKYDIVIDAYGKPESNIIVVFSNARKKVGFYKWYTSLIYTHSVKQIDKPLTNAGLALENRLNLIRFLSPTTKLNIKPEIYLTATEVDHGRNILRQHNINFSKKIYMIGVVGSGPDKSYPNKYMAQVLDFIVGKTGATLIFNYMPSQGTEAKAIFELCRPETRNNIKIDIPSKSIREFLSITYHCNALIGNEGGAVNMAKALDVPTFTIFSPWIKKEAWNSFENGNDTVSVHLKDFKPELYNGKSPKEMKDQALSMYQSYKPQLIFPVLEKYVENN